MEYWIVYDLATGAALYRGAGPAGTAAMQSIPNGASYVFVTQSIAQAPEIDLNLMRAFLTIRVDNAAEQMRGRFITALPGQVGAYVLKAQVARRWLADNTASTVGLASEAQVRRMTIADLAAEVIANEEAWLHASDAIEGVRFGAKVAIAEAQTFGAMVEAAKVDWSALTDG